MNKKFYWLILVQIICISCTSKKVSDNNQRDINLPTIETGFILETFENEVNCDRTYETNGIVNIKWVDPTKSMANQRIDLSAYKHGFQNNLFTSILPDLNRKAQTFVKPKGQVSSKELDLKMNDIFLSDLDFDENGNSLIRLSGFNPGMNYYIRICNFDQQQKKWIPSQKMRFQAPICPRDKFLK